MTIEKMTLTFLGLVHKYSPHLLLPCCSPTHAHLVPDKATFSVLVSLLPHGSVKWEMENILVTSPFASQPLHKPFSL